ncbi:cullin 4 [Cokeromyces recurvatus]|uniref:cullin 4 n=1 Tax=Cokeromyces recurvatus TaxID=90255 RepID=UPI0022201799|nr:cullin 4 [Cokeromyces recurvatus]KAI7897480.1 cullin 4 [Cokeromyces recurvatus]
MEIDNIVPIKNIHLGAFHKPTSELLVTITNMIPTRLNELSDAEFEKSWEKQKACIQAIFSTEQHKNFNYLTTSRLCESCCRFGKSEKLYEALVREIEQYTLEIQKSLVPLNRELLVRLNSSWNTYCHHLTVIRTVFMALDRTYILPKTKFQSIIELGKGIFSKNIMDIEEFRNVVVAEVLQLIKLDRDSKIVDVKLIHDILQIMIELSYYSSDFENRFLTSTNNYYKEEANELINALSVSDYIQHASIRLQEESQDRIQNYLDNRTKRSLTHAVVDQLIYKKASKIIEKGFNSILDNNLVEPLKLFYELLGQSEEMNLLRKAFADYIKRQGAALIKDPKNDPTMIPSLLKFKKKMDRILEYCFHHDESLMNVSKESFEYFINTRGNKPAEMLAKYIDSRLKISIKKQRMNVTEVDLAVLDSALTLFRYIQTKDTFEAYYKRFLAKRLLLDRSISQETEKHVLEVLKLECGHEFTKNFENMFKDIQVSNDLAIAFKDYEKHQSRMPMNVKVIAQAFWPTFPVSKIKLPPNMQASQRLYEEFYTSKFNGRKLNWQNSLSSLAIVAHYPKGNKEIVLSLLQAIILLLFNDTRKKLYTFSEIQAATGLENKDLSSLLASLSTETYPLIKKTTSTTSTITPQDSFQYNLEFESPNVRIRIPAAVFEQATDEHKEVEEKVQVNRKHQLEAAIVRIMKAKKTLSHSALINEIFTQMKYPVDANDIKKRIEALIERDYLARDINDNSLYNYIS